MIHFVFGENGALQKEATPPTPAFRFDHDSMRLDPDGQIVARLLPNGMWATDKKRYVRGNCMNEGQMQICLEDDSGNASRCFGPYDCIRITDGAIYADDRIFMMLLEDSHRWVCLHDRSEWPVVVVKSV